jgi:hypothetical protein
VFRPRTNRRRFSNALGRRFARMVRENFRQVALIVVIAAVVSLSMDLLWMVVGKMQGPPVENVIYQTPPSVWPETIGSLKH